MIIIIMTNQTMAGRFAIVIMNEEIFVDDAASSGSTF